MARIVTSISILKELKQESLEVARSGKYPGISDFSSIVEYALDKLLHPEKYLQPLIELDVPQQEVP